MSDDNIINFPNSSTEGDEARPDSEVEEMVNLIIEDRTTNTSNSYPMQMLNVSATELDQVNDLETGGKRNRRWGALLSLSVLPNVDRLERGPMTLPVSIPQFIDSDSLEELRERIITELDKSIKIAQMAKDDPDKFRKVEQALHQREIERQVAGQ